jgi:5-oxoprolinase (ATP-hydrolysing)
MFHSKTLIELLSLNACRFFNFQCQLFCCLGGSHLPDLTIITPVFYPNQEKPVFFVANRGHHADIGGISPGSMPPHSKFLWEEGATFKSFKIVDRGVFQESELIQAFEAPGQHPGCSGSRGLQDNLSDLKAQIAANQVKEN